MRAWFEAAGLWGTGPAQFSTNFQSGRTRPLALSWMGAASSAKG